MYFSKWVDPKLDTKGLKFSLKVCTWDELPINLGGRFFTRPLHLSNNCGGSSERGGHLCSVDRRIKCNVMRSLIVIKSVQNYNLMVDIVGYTNVNGLEISFYSQKFEKKTGPIT